MQHIDLVCLGKPAGFYLPGIQEYEKRLGPLCRFRAQELSEEPLTEKSASPALVRAALEKEGEHILAALPKKARMLALCVEGKALDSEGFAALLEEMAQDGGGQAAFVIGSSHGLAPCIKTAAYRRFSLSALTLPHQLARLVLTEQIYRAFQIRAGSRYHK